LAASRKRAASESHNDSSSSSSSSSGGGGRSRSSLANKRRLVAPDLPFDGIKQENLQTEVDDILKQLGKGEVSLHVYENAQRVYLRYRENEAWHMRDFAEYFPIHFHSEGTIGVPIPKQQQQQPGVAGGDLAVRPTSLGDREIRSLNLSFKRKEHYWRRGIWVRVVVDVMSGEGIAKDATGSINVELFSLRGEPIKKACEKCSKYYFRYKNIEPNGEMAPAFEIEEHDRNTAVSAGRASFNMRVWECSHHYLTPHTLAFSWINPMNPSMKVEAICPKEIVISSGSGQEKKLREMRVNPDDLFKEFIDALILMDDGKYTQAIESLRCIRWKAFHFLGPFLATCVDEKIADCFLRTGNYQTAINHFNRTLSLLGESGDRILPSLKYYMQALLYLKIATAAYYKARESPSTEMTVFLKKAHKYLEISHNSIKNAKECETKDAPQNVHDFAKQYLKYSYYQDLMGICLKMKPFETNESESNLSFQKMVEAFKELEINYTKLDEDTLWSGPELMSVFGPLADKLHITVDKLKKLLHSPFLTNQAITRPVLSSSSSSSPSPPASGESPTLGASPTAAATTDAGLSSGPVPMEEAPMPTLPTLSTASGSGSGEVSSPSGLEQTKEILLSLKQAQEEAEELHPKGHRTICISRCLSTLFMYLSGDLPEAEALKKIEEATKEIEQFWVNERVGGKFEVQQFASIVNFLRSGRRDENFNIENPFAIFLEREEFQLYRLWIHSPLDVIIWAILQLSPA
jgi:tetratricopeptide (TPR) repeat protein